MIHDTATHDTTQDTTTHDDTIPDATTGTRRADVVVIGAGLAGMAAGATAARAGRRVVVFDARSPGGRARSVVRNGVVFNEGAHALYRAGAGAKVLRDLGVRVEGGSPPLDRYHTWWQGELAALPLTPSALVTTPLLSPRSKVAAGRLLGSVGRLADQAGDVTFGDWLDERQTRPDLRRLLEVVTRLVTYAADPLDLPAATALRQLAVSGKGVDYVDGGWQTLVDGLLAAAERSGASVVGHAPVTSLERDGAEWVVHTDRMVVATPSVVIASGGPAAAESLVDREVGWVDDAGPVRRVAALDVCTTSAAPVEYLFSSDDPLYLSQHSPTARMAPDGHRLYCLMRYLRVDEDLDHVTAREQLEAHAARAGLPPRGSSERTVERFLASMPVAWGSPVVGRRRPRGDELAHEGIHVAGDWVGDHLLADAALATGARAGELAARHRLVA